ncbi:DNA-binding protein, partial [Pseudomonas aeruginosa]|uniref:hypothetical protein n=1 Tax=Pseudomonas aeruginosa TaxID=287 RepID=UPI000FF87305
VLSAHEPPAEYLSKRQDGFLIWVEAYYQLTKSEREKVVKFVLREGLAKLISYIDADNQDAIEQDNEEVLKKLKSPPETT